MFWEHSMFVEFLIWRCEVVVMMMNYFWELIYMEV